MLVITSDPKIKALLENGRKQRSDAFVGVLRWFLSIRLPKSIAKPTKQAAPTQRCPS